MDQIVLQSLFDELEKIGAQVYRHRGKAYSVPKLWELAKDLPAERLSVEDAKDYMGAKTWTGGKSPSEVLAAQDDTHGHMSRIGRADLRRPIVLAPNQGVADGLHRIAKATQQGKDTIPVRRFRSWDAMRPALEKRAKKGDPAPFPPPWLKRRAARPMSPAAKKFWEREAKYLHAQSEKGHMVL